MNKEEKIQFANKYLLDKENKHSNHIYKESYFKKKYPEIYSELILIKFPDDFKFGQKLWHFIYDDFNFEKRCKCSLHGKLKFRDFRRGYAQFCKPHCEEYDRISIEKRKLTRIKNSGSLEESYRKGIEKNKKTCLEKYGVTNGGGTQESIDKIRQTKIERYGSFDVLNKLNKKNGDITRIKNYGSVEESYKHIIEKRKETLSSKSDEYYNNISQKIKQTKLERYGDENYVNIEKMKKTCLERYGVDNYFKSDSLINENRNRRNQQVLDKYSEILYRTDDVFTCRCIDENCNFCDNKTFDIRYSSFFNRKFYNIDICTNRTPEKVGSFSSCEEKSLLNFIKSIYDGEIIENDRSVLRGKELDIYIPELNLAFEFNGVYWHNEFNKEITYHQKKSLSCMKKGIQLIHIWEDDWLYKNEIIKDFIKSKFGVYDVKIGARKCEVKIVPNNIAYRFLTKNHIQGGVKNGKSIGLYYCNELVEILTFGGLRRNMGGKQVDGHYEIYRVCSKIGYNIQGGFSKLLNYFENVYNPIEIITYANLDYSVGNVYIMNGFCKCGISKPVYSWVVGGIRKNRSNFMKSKLDECKKNPNLTETDVMHSRGFWKCWDSGKIKFIKKR